MQRIKNKNIFRQFIKTELPYEYLAARLKGRKTNITRKWDVILSSDSPADTLLLTRYKLMHETSKNISEDFLNKELFWLYKQMNFKLRQNFFPLFFYFELRKIIACLRLKQSEEEKYRIQNILKYSLLSKQVQHLLTDENSFDYTIKNLLSYLIYCFPLYEKLLKIIESSYFQKQIEQALYELFFYSIKKINIHPAVKKYLIFNIDSINILALYKSLGYSEKTIRFIKGGFIDINKFYTALEKGSYQDLKKICALFRPRALEEYDINYIENFLLNGLLEKSTQLYRQYSDIGFILYYITLVLVEAKYSSLIIYGQNIEKSILQNELNL
ncbi:MAG: V-type ATPase subunit [Spirochaetia bacterium]|nr:V-type ATPase subunit [Spirochaetia bacterium]